MNTYIYIYRQIQRHLLSFFRSLLFSYNANVTMDVIIYAGIAQKIYICLCAF